MNLWLGTVLRFLGHRWLFPSHCTSLGPRYAIVCSLWAREAWRNFTRQLAKKTAVCFRLQRPVVLPKVVFDANDMFSGEV